MNPRTWVLAVGLGSIMAAGLAVLAYLTMARAG